MKITTPMRITAADSESRTITGQIVAFDVAANASTGKVLFQAGSIQPASVKLNLEHDSARPIGRSIDMSADASGMNATFKISQTSAGTDALVEAMDGLRDGFSVEAEATEFAYNEDGTMVVSAAQLVGVALTHNPAFDAARVERVAATEGDEVSESTEDAEEPTTTTEGDEVDNTVTNADAVESVEAAKSITAAATAVGYTKPRLDFSAQKHLEMSIKAALGSEEARSYIAAAADTTDNAGLVPTRQLTTVINGLANATRSNIDAISRGTLPDAGMTFEIPKITQLPSVTEEAEAGTVADVDQTSEFLSVSVKKYSGSQTFSVELFDRSSPLFIDELMRNMAAQYAKVTDTAVNAALVSGATLDGTSITTYPTAAELLGVIARGAASVYSGSQGFARNLIVNTSQWSNLMTLNDSGRPIYNASQPSNAGGVVRPDSVRGNVAGLDLYVTANTAATTDTDGSILVVNPDAYTWYESPTYQLRADVIATGQISVMMYGYGAIATKIGAGAFKVNKTS
jgi:HK97 family phage prohead protease